MFIGFVGVWKPRLHPHNPRNLPTLTSRSATFLFIRRSAIFQGSPPPRGHFRKVRQERIGKVPRKTEFFFHARVQAHSFIKNISSKTAVRFGGFATKHPADGNNAKMRPPLKCRHSTTCIFLTPPNNEKDLSIGPNEDTAEPVSHGEMARASFPFGPNEQARRMKRIKRRDFKRRRKHFSELFAL